MRALLTTIPLPRLIPKLNRYKQCFEVGDVIHYKLHRRSSWYEQEVVGVRRYKIFGRVYRIKYKINYTTSTDHVHSQQQLLTMQKKYDEEYGVTEAQVIEKKTKQSWLYESDGRW